MFAPLLALATLAPLPPAPVAPAPLAIDDLAPRSAFDGWCFVMEVLDRFREAPYGLRIEGTHVPQRPAWVGEPLAQPTSLPPLPIGARAIEVSELEISGGGLGDSATCSARLELALVADDTLGAALLLEHLLAHFEELPSVSMWGRPETVPLAEEAGLSVSALRLQIDLSRLAPQRPAAEERFVSTAVAVRAIGMREGSRVRAVRFFPKSVSIDDGTVRSVFRLTPARRATGALPARLFHLLARLEATDPELWSTRIDLGPWASSPESEDSQGLEPQAAAPAGWSWKVELESQRPFQAAPAPAPTSALDALTFLREVLAGFRADPYRVNVTGIFPDRARAGVGQRPPALSDAGLRRLVTAGGYGIEVRSLVIDTDPRSGPGNVLLLVSLRCTSEEGVVEGTRLFEFLAASLRSQPESVTLNQPQVTELADGSGVFVSSLRLALRVPDRTAGVGPDLDLPATNPLTHIRSTAALDGIGVGSLQIKVWEKRRSGESRTEYWLQPRDKQASFELDQVLELFWTLEREEPGYTLANLRVSPQGRLSPDDPLPGTWVFEAVLSTVDRR